MFSPALQARFEADMAHLKVIVTARIHRDVKDVARTLRSDARKRDKTFHGVDMLPLDDALANTKRLLRASRSNGRSEDLRSLLIALRYQRRFGGFFAKVVS
jgi:hypothetical protein